LTTYVLTPDHLARARNHLHERRDALIERYRQELSALDTEISTKLAELDDLERKVVEMTAEYPVKVPRSPPKRFVASRPVPSGPRWTPEENDRLMAADQSGLEQLAQERNTTIDAIKRRQRLRARRGAQTASPEARAPEALTPDPGVGGAVDDAWRSPEPMATEPVPSEVAAPSSSENTHISEPTLEPPRSLVAEPYEIADDDSGKARARSDKGEVFEAAAPTAEGGPAIPQPQPEKALFVDKRSIEWNTRPRRTPGRAVDGVVDNGPTSRRVYDPVAFASRSSE
jgi:hypothetical protein